ncbi:MAG: hypothetical protein MK081_08235 [Flavobacteriales bacterium]|nr:hypothetical protein [Flavobacteriales bacterium]
MNVRKSKELAGHAGPIYDLFTGRSKGHVLTASGDKFIAEWNLDEGVASPFSVKLEEAVFSGYFHEDKQLLLAGTASGNLHVIDLQANKELRNLAVHKKGVFSMIHIPQENWFIIGGGDGFLSVWDDQQFELIRHFKVSDFKIRSLSLVDEQLAVTSGDGFIRIFDLPWLNEQHAINAHEGGAYCAVKHPNKPVLISGGKDAHLRFWHLEDFSEIRNIPAHNFGIYQIKFSPDGKKALSASRDKTLKLWNSDDFGLIERIDRPKYPAHTHSINSILWLDNNQFISAGDDRKIKLWGIDEGLRAKL